MKKNWIVLINIVLVLGIVGFVVRYADNNGRLETEQRTRSFTNMTAAMEQVTANYLEGEQRICDVWAHYIDRKGMTMSEAADFIRVSHVIPNAAAHLIYLDDGSLSGLSTRSGAANPDNYAVSYKNIDLDVNFDAIPEIGEGVNITRAYANPLSARQSIAFYNKITLLDESDESPRPALLLRVVPLTELEQKWTFPQEAFPNAEFSMIDRDGGYIIKGRSFKNSSFFEFYKSYTQKDAAEVRALQERLYAGPGSVAITNSRGEACMLAFAPVRVGGDWALLSLIHTSELGVNGTDWTLIGIVAASLLVLLVFDFIFMQRVNRRMKAVAHEAEMASRAKTDFLSTMSHDIRTPMNAIIGLTTIAEKNLGDADAIGEALRKISLASNHLLTLINDILDISKVESGKLTLTPVTFSIVETADNLVNLSQPMVKEKHIDFNFRIRDMDVEYLRADQLRLNQIYINLLSNAIKYTEPGGRVTVDMSEHPAGAGQVQLTYVVADTGIGMTEAFMKRMYQPFSRQTDSRVNTIQGTGLGLAITKQMVDLMGGTIECTSAPGVGTTFTVTLTLPVADRQPEEMRLEPVDVLVVDDDEVMLATARETLRTLGANTDTAISGADAIAAVMRRHAEDNDYGVIIVDWKMPDMNGIEVARYIREEGVEVPILLISAYDWSDIEEEARTVGANGFVSKPLFRSTLYEKISELLGVKARNVHPEEDDSDIAGMHIFVVEDNDVNWEIISMLLSMHGIVCDRAENGQIAVDRLRQAEPDWCDLVFMDVQMPVMNGLDATRAIRKLDTWAANVPIIAMTADAFSENVAECIAAGMNGHIAKPIDMKLVLREIRRIREEKNQ